jgi:predicted nucleic acid-binding protein
MIRAVFDTNVIVSALLQSLGPSSRLLMRCFDGSIQLCVSGPVYAEYEDVLRRPRLARDPEIIAGALQTIRQNGAGVFGGYSCLRATFPGRAVLAHDFASRTTIARRRSAAG